MFNLHEKFAEWSSSGWIWLGNHLLQATLFALLVYAASFFLRRGSARGRYIVWLIASAKFVIPSLALLYLSRQVGIELPTIFNSPIEPVQAVATAPQVSLPVSGLITEPVVSANLLHGHSEVACVLTVIWMIGCIGFLAMWRRRRAQLLSVLKAGSRINEGREVCALNRVRQRLRLRREIGLVVSRIRIEPGVWGIWRPVIVLPQNLVDDLSDAEIETLMLHELAHVTRWDNLFGSLQMLLCCLLWFHPVVWLINRKLQIEREQACDEAVLRLGGTSKIYASSLLKVCRFSLNWKVAGLSSLTGSDAKRRIMRVLNNELNLKLNLRQRMLVYAITAALIFIWVGSGLLVSDRTHAQQAKPRGTAAQAQEPTRRPFEGREETPGARSPVDAQDAAALPEINVQVENSEGAPLTILSATVKAFKPGSVHEESDEYTVQPKVTVMNNTSQRITDFVLNIKNTESSFEYDTARTRIMIHSGGTFSGWLGKFVSLPGDPHDLKVKVIGVRFADGSEWGNLMPLTRQGGEQSMDSPRSNAEVAALGGPSTSPAMVGTGGPVMAAPSAAAGATSSADSPPPSYLPYFMYGDAKMIRLGGGILQNHATRRVEPARPPGASVGTVVVEVIVSEEGNVESARIVSGEPFHVASSNDALLESAAIETARQWKFKPEKAGGFPVKIIGELFFIFK